MTKVKIDEDLLRQCILLMKDDGLYNDFDNLSMEEQETVLQCLQEYLDGGHSSTHLQLKEPDFKYTPPTPEEFLTDPYFMGERAKDIYPRWVDELLFVLDPVNRIKEWILCLSGDTLIPLLNGEVWKLKDLYASWLKKEEPFWVYSVSPSGEVVPGECESVVKFAEDQLYKVTLDNGTSFRANASHEMVLRNGTKCMIRDMKIGDRLMPFHTTEKAMDRQRLDGYEQVYLPGPQKYAYTHRVVGKMIAGGECPLVINEDRAVLHHKDLNRKNNDPSNLEWMGWAEHRKLHTVKKTPEHLEKIIESARKRAKDPNSNFQRAKVRFLKTERGRKLSIRNLSKAKVSIEERRRRLKKATTIRWADPDQRKQASIRCAERSKGNQWGKLLIDNSITLEDIRREYFRLGDLQKTRKSLRMSRNRMVRVLHDADMTMRDLKQEYNLHKTKLKGKKEIRYSKLLKTDVSVNDIYEEYEKVGTTAGVCRNLNIDHKRLSRILGNENLDICDLRANYKNHRVVSIQKDNVENVYCLNIPKWGNFAIVTDEIKKSGVFSGNTGSIGQGKSWVSNFAQAYKLCFLSCLKNPQQYIGLAQGTSIVFSVFNLTLAKTDLTLYKDFKSILNSSPFFRDNFPLKTVYGSGGVEKEIDFPNDIILVSGSNATHALSLNVYSCTLDEMNFRDSKYVISYEEKSQAFELYRNIHTRIVSRFVGYDPGILVLISSRKTITDFLEKHIEKQSNKQYVHISDFALYQVKPKMRFFPSGRTFRMVIGDRSHQMTSRVLRDGEEVEDGVKVVEDIPVELKEDAELDPDGFVRDVIGAATYPSSPLISVKERITDCTDFTRSHPFTVGSVCLNINTPDTIEEYLILDKLVRDAGASGLKPLFCPEKPRIIGLDLGLTKDSGAVVMGFPHTVKTVRTSVEDPATGRLIQKMLPRWFIYYDFFLEIAAPQKGTGEIDFEKIEKFVIYLRDTLHFNIRRVSSDGFQSRHMRQNLYKRKFDAVITSVDRDDIAYIELRQAILERRTSFYFYEPFLEIEYLYHDRRGKKGKVDHFKGRKKDVTDAAAAVAFHCSEFPMHEVLVPDQRMPHLRSSRLKKDAKVMDLNSRLLDDYAKTTSKGRKYRRIIDVNDTGNPLI